MSERTSSTSLTRRTRILATLGPATHDPAVLDALLAAGLDAVRLNFSHGTQAWHAETFARVRAAAQRAGREIAVLQDLQGPKIRLGEIAGALKVTSGERLTITTRDIVGGDGVVPTDYADLPRDVAPGLLILLDEGRVSVVVRAVEGSEVVCEVVDGGVLSSNKGLNVPGAALTAAAMTAKDRDDVRFGLDLGVDFVALSFVRSADDVTTLRQVMLEHGRVVPIIAKIEKPQAIDALDEIIAAADGVMVARGDLAIEAALEMIPAHQKLIIERANRAGKLVVTATQMLESMTDNPLPTRAEVTDVANAVLDGTDVVMLSGETAVGKHPVATVRWMGKIAAAAEDHLLHFVPVRPPPTPADGFARVITRLAAQAARDAGAKAIVVFTQSGYSAMRLSDERPQAPILAFTRELATERRLALYWGVRALPQPATRSTAELLAHAQRVCLERGWAVAGDTLVIVLGAHAAGAAAEHSLKLLRLGETAAEGAEA